VLGSGVQARSHLEALERVWTFTEARVWSPTPARRAAFVTEMSSLVETPLREATSAEDAIEGADVVVLATSSVEPVLESAWVKDGAHVVSVGACRPNQREMDPVLVARSRLYVDSRDAALVEAGDIVRSIAEGRFTASHIVGELGELLVKQVEGRRSENEVTIFKSLGLAVEDVAAATLVFRLAVTHEVGTELDM
jgi:ornithine cyclodeaminase